MDEQRFDTWIRSLGELPSRRRVLSALVATLLAWAGIGDGAADGSARRGKRHGRGRIRRADRAPQSPDRGKRRVVAERGGKGKGKGKGKKKKTKPKPSPGPCVRHGDCPAGRVCCNGSCQTPGPATCCSESKQCGPEWGCLWCDGGRCRPVPDGRECQGCKRCKNGACTEPDDRLLCGGECCPAGEVCVGVFDKECCPVAKACANDCCPANEHCDPETTECCPSCGTACCDTDTHICRNPQANDCCPRCVNRQCCPSGQACVDEGVLGSRFCCDTPCGERSDGTFEDCCDPGETCVDGACKLELECPDGRPPCDDDCCEEDEVCCGGTCVKNMKICPGKTRPFCARTDRDCCGDVSCDEGQDCCDPGGNDFCCDAGRCVERNCCPNDRVICEGKCCPLGDVCCGGVCCFVLDCLNNACCAQGVCGVPGSAHRVCPTAEETCCHIEDPDPEIGAAGYACPPGAPTCAFNGECCPEFTLYRGDCGGCCPGLSCNGCVPATLGRM